MSDLKKRIYDVIKYSPLSRPIFYKVKVEPFYAEVPKFLGEMVCTRGCRSGTPGKFMV